MYPWLCVFLALLWLLRARAFRRAAEHLRANLAMMDAMDMHDMELTEHAIPVAATPVIEAPIIGGAVPVATIPVTAMAVASTAAIPVANELPPSSYTAMTQHA